MKAFWRKVPEARPSKKRGLCEHEAESTRTGKCRVPLFRDPDLLSGPLVCPLVFTRSKLFHRALLLVLDRW